MCPFTTRLENPWGQSLCSGCSCLSNAQHSAGQILGSPSIFHWRKEWLIDVRQTWAMFPLQKWKTEEIQIVPFYHGIVSRPSAYAHKKGVPPSTHGRYPWGPLTSLTWAVFQLHLPAPPGSSHPLDLRKSHLVHKMFQISLVHSSPHYDEIQLNWFCVCVCVCVCVCLIW